LEIKNIHFPGLIMTLNFYKIRKRAGKIVRTKEIFRINITSVEEKESGYLMFVKI